MDDVVQERAAREAAPWVAKLARYGYAAKGAVYLVVGWLALQAALGSGGATTDTEGALRAIFRQPLGPFILLLVGVGLFAYTSWRLTQSLLDVENKGRDLRGLIKRTGYLMSGLAYGGLGISAVRQAVGLAVEDGRSQEDWTALVLSHPFGRLLVIAAGGLLAALAINAALVALRGLYRRKLEVDEMSPALRGWAAGLAVCGLLARGVVFGLLAVFFVQAGWDADPDQAGGLSDVLVAVAAQPQGPWLLGVMAIGLVAYGLYAEVEARFRRIRLL
ncbi:MAG: DUF1206 domain-containing protein [Trueperaceae bacterium]